MKKVNFNLLTVIFAFTIVLTIPCISTAQDSRRGNFEKAKKIQNSSAERMQKYGDTDAEVLKLYNQAIDEYKKCITVNNKDTGEAYHCLGRILFTDPRLLRNYAEAVQYLCETVEIYEREKNRKYLYLIVIMKSVRLYIG